MAINIGNQGVEAIRELKDSPQLRNLIEAFGQVALKRMIASIASPVEQRVAQTSHAHGVWEVYEALSAAFENKLPSQLQPPMPTMGRVAARGKTVETADG